MTSWKLTAFAPKKVVQQALLTHDEIEDWDFNLVIAGREIAEDRPKDWVLEGWYHQKPGKAQKQALSDLFAGNAPKIEVEQLPDEDWLTLSQQGVEPIRAGRFHIHTPDFPPDPCAINFIIPAAQAFGTGQHETTAGCLEMLSAMKKSVPYLAALRILARARDCLALQQCTCGPARKPPLPTLIPFAPRWLRRTQA